MFGVNHLLDLIHPAKSVAKLSKLIYWCWQPVKKMTSTCQIYYLFVLKSDHPWISNPYYQSIFEKINTIGQILAKLQRRTSFTYTEYTNTDRQTDHLSVIKSTSIAFQSIQSIIIWKNQYNWTTIGQTTALEKFYLHRVHKYKETNRRRRWYFIIIKIYYILNQKWDYLFTRRRCTYIQYIQTNTQYRAAPCRPP